MNYPNDVELALLADTDASVARKANKRLKNRQSAAAVSKKVSRYISKPNANTLLSHFNFCARTYIPRRK
jgi:glutamine synthetase adenylyltransferase